MEIRNYTIGNNRIKRGLVTGFQLCKDGVLQMQSGVEHAIILPGIDSYIKGCQWGRLRLQAVLPQEAILVVRAFSVDITDRDEKEEADRLNVFFRNPDISLGEKKQFFEQAEGIQIFQATDLLLYELKGRFLWLFFEVVGEGEGTIGDICISNPGDNFMQTFPEIYQDFGGFFHRYLSVFSSMYKDVTDELEHVDRYLDIDRAPTSFLHMFAAWQGLEIEGEFLEDKILRKLLREIYRLNSIKGTKEAIRELIQIVLSEDSIIVERNLMDQYIALDEKAIYNELYGDSIQDITILINHKPVEKLQAQLLYLIMQFKPIRGRVHLVFYGECNRLDSYCFLDKNAVLQQMSECSLDGDGTLDGSVMLGS